MDVIIDGHKLSEGQIAAVRVAIVDFYGSLKGHPEMLGDDEQGKTMAAAYVARLEEVSKMMPIDGAF